MRPWIRLRTEVLTTGCALNRFALVLGVILCLPAVAGHAVEEKQGAVRCSPAQSKANRLVRKGRKNRQQKKRARKPDPAVKKAKRHYTEGKKLFAAGKYDQALRAYTAGYSSKPLPAFLFNMAQCHRNIGTAARAVSAWDEALENYDRAVFLFKSYLKESSDEQREESIRQAIAEIENERKAASDGKSRQLETERAAQLAVAEEAHLKKEEAEARRVQAALAIEQTRLEQLRAEKETEPALYEKWWFWTIVGGVVLSGAGVATWALTQDTSPNIPAGNLGPGVVDCRSGTCTY